MTDQDKARRKKELEAALLLLLTGVTAYNFAQTDDLIAGKQDLQGWYQNIVTRLGQAHGSAFWIGKQVGQGYQPFGQQDANVGDSMELDQAMYLQKFKDKLADDSLNGGELDPDAIKSQLELYTERVRGTANEASVFGHGEGVCNYILDGGVPFNAHCETCLERVNGNPWTLSDLPGIPGDGSTDCGVNCHCNIEIDGVIVTF